MERPVQDNANPIGKLRCLVEIVSDKHNSAVELFMHVLEQGIHLLFCSGIKRGERFVKQKNLRAHDQRAGKGGSLSFAATDYSGIAVGNVLDAEQSEHLINALVDFRLGGFGHFEPVANIIAYGQMWEKRMVLIKNSQVTLLNGQCAHIFAVKQDGTVFQREGARNRFQQHGFSRTCFSYDGKYFPWSNRELVYGKAKRAAPRLHVLDMHASRHVSTPYALEVVFSRLRVSHPVVCPAHLPQPG